MNALGRAYALITPHLIYLALDAVPTQRQQAYRELFRNHLDADALHDIREALNHDLVWGVRTSRTKSKP